MEERLVTKPFFLNTAKIVHIFRLKPNHVGGGENASNQHIVLFVCCFFKDFFLSGKKSFDCLGEESNIKKKKKNAMVESYVKFLYSL